MSQVFLLLHNLGIVALFCGFQLLHPTLMLPEEKLSDPGSLPGN